LPVRDRAGEMACRLEGPLGRFCRRVANDLNRPRALYDEG